MTWRVREKTPDSVDNNLQAYPPLLRDLLFARGIEREEDARIFLEPDYERDFHDPFLLSNMDRAVSRILQAIEKDEKVVIFADYDADGGPAAVALSDFFKKIGFTNFTVYIPHRYKEGYGLNIEAIDKFEKEGATLLVTLDCGITNVQEVKHSNERGIDVIVTDHHLSGDTLPPAYAIVNPNQPGDGYPNKHLCGGGVCFKLIQALVQKGNFQRISPGWEKWLLDVCGISTMSDMVPLVDENRAIAHFGLQVLRQTKRPGLLKLFRKRRVDVSNLSEEDIQFIVTPHINAASRMASPDVAFHLLSTNDFNKAYELVAFLSEKNEERKRVVFDMLKQVDEVIEKNTEEKPIIFIGDESWKPGVLGLAAHRVMEKHKKPVCLWGMEGSSMIRGSCRSDGSVNVVELMKRIPDGHFAEFGGHMHSGGFSVSDTPIEKIADKIVETYNKMEKEKLEKEELVIDKELSSNDITWENFHAVRRMSPFGIGNEQPTFLFRRLQVLKTQFFGKGKEHLRVDLKKENGGLTQAVRFFFPEDEYKDVSLTPGAYIDVVGHLEKDTFSSPQKLRVRLLSAKDTVLT